MSVVTLEGLVLGEPPAAWSAIGFAVNGDSFATGGVTLRCGHGEPGVNGWQLSVPAEVGGLTRMPVSPQPDALHPNGVIGLDHLVVSTPDLDRTTLSFAAHGVGPRRTREAGFGDLLQRFFVLGTAVVEVLGPKQAGSGPATFWGITFVVRDLDRLAEQLGDRLSAPRDAVQPGRRIAVLDPEHTAITTRVAFLTPRG